MSSRSTLLGRLSPSCLLVLLALLAGLQPVLAQPRTPQGIGSSAAPPAQPSALMLQHRSGQTFITWRERDELTGERYRVYRHHQPIIASNLAEATLLYEVPEDSSRFYANRHRVSRDAWAERYVERYVIEDRGAPLEAGRGLLVWTLSQEDLAHGKQGYYAVTTVSAEGVENRGDLGGANTAGPIEETGADPLPVEVAANIGARGHVYIQYMDLRHWNPTLHAPHAGNGYYGLPTEGVSYENAIQYAYDYAVFEPSPMACGGAFDGPVPVLLSLHAWSGNWYAPPYSDPYPNWCAYKVFPVDVSETWYFGAARDHDYRRGGRPTTGDVIVNYTEARVLRMVYDLLRQPPGPPADVQRVYVFGHSMGASGALAMALRYPNVFAAAYAGQPMTDYNTAGGWRGTVMGFWGEQRFNLPVQIIGPGDWAQHLQEYSGSGIWDWQNHQANVQQRLADEMVPLGIDCGLNDTSVTWETQGRPAFGALNAGLRAWGGVVTNDTHRWSYFRGLPPALDFVEGVPFAGLQVVRDESVPGLSNASGNLPIPPDETGGYNQTLEWSAGWNPWDGAPIDTPDLWRISLRTTDGSYQTVDVTPRRLQRFVIHPQEPYYWENHRVANGLIKDRGVVTATQDGLVTVPAVAISPDGNRLTLRHISAMPTVVPPIHEVDLPLLFKGIAS